MKQTVRDLHKQHNLFEDKIKLTLTHQYDVKLRVWKFNGYRCIHCGNHMKYATNIEKHSEYCKQLNKKSRNYGDVDSEVVRTILGDKWEPRYQQYASTPPPKTS